jgi:hypothetical protein
MVFSPRYASSASDELIIEKETLLKMHNHDHTRCVIIITKWKDNADQGEERQRYDVLQCKESKCIRPTHAKCHNHDLQMLFMPEPVPNSKRCGIPIIQSLSCTPIPTLIAVPARMCMHPNPSIHPNSNKENRCVLCVMQSNAPYVTVDAGRS